MINHRYDESMTPLMQKILLLTLVLIGWVLPIHALLEFTFLRILLSFITNLIALTIILYVAGLTIVGDERTKLSRVFVMALLGTAVSLVLSTVVALLLSVYFSWEYLFAVRIVLYLIMWLSLIEVFYTIEWLRAFAVAVVALGIMLVIELLLASVLLALRFI